MFAEVHPSHISVFGFNTPEFVMVVAVHMVSFLQAILEGHQKVTGKMSIIHLSLENII